MTNNEVQRDFQNKFTVYIPCYIQKIEKILGLMACQNRKIWLVIFFFLFLKTYFIVLETECVWVSRGERQRGREEDYQAGWLHAAEFP